MADAERPANHRVEDHFRGKAPEVRAIYDRILAVARKLGPVDEDPKKTSIHLNRKSAFAGVETRKDCLLLNIKTPTAIDSPRAIHAERVSANRHHTRFRLLTADEVDANIADWLKAGYEISG